VFEMAAGNAQRVNLAVQVVIRECNSEPVPFELQLA